MEFDVKLIANPGKTERGKYCLARFVNVKDVGIDGSQA